MVAHDNSYKLLFSHPRMVEDLLHGFIKEEWISKLDFSTLEKVSGSYVSDDLRDREDDIIWRLRWGEEWLLIYLLLEFQSTVDSFMPVRIMTYVGLLYQELIRNKQLSASGKLPPVLPVVLYNGRQSWNVPDNIGDLIQEVPGGLDRFKPQIHYLLIDENRYSESELKASHNLAAALFRLEKSRNSEDVQRVLATLIDWLKESEQTGLRRAFTVWLRRVFLPARIPGAQIPELKDLQEVKTMLAERVVEWTKEWKEEGLQEGIEKGVQKGEARILIRQLKLKFGTLADDVIERVENANVDTLLEWSERILTAENIEEVVKN